MSPEYYSGFSSATLTTRYRLIGRHGIVISSEFVMVPFKRHLVAFLAFSLDVHVHLTVAS
jgi:hypothetical protein